MVVTKCLTWACTVHGAVCTCCSITHWTSSLCVLHSCCQCCDLLVGLLQLCQQHPLVLLQLPNELLLSCIELLPLLTILQGIRQCRR